MNAEALAAGAVVFGPGDPSLPAMVVAATPLGPQVFQVVYEQGDRIAKTTVTADELANWQLIENEAKLPDGDPAGFLLAMEALRINKAHVFDDRAALSAVKGVEPLPHQITAVYHHMLEQRPIKFLLADDPGAGKTIMAGLLMRELLLRGDVERILVVAPGSLVTQWLQEMETKFGLYFTDGSSYQEYPSQERNWFDENDLVVASVDQLKRGDRRNEQLAEVEWDLIIVDEAHKMSCPVGLDGQPDPSMRFKLGEMLRDRTRHFLLMTATPHNGKDEDFRQFMSLIDPDRFHGKLEGTGIRAQSSDCIRRLIKEQMRRFDGSRLFPPREARTVGFQLTPMAQQLYTQVTAYVQEEYNRAERIADPQKRQAIGFALAILQRRLASSPASIAKSLERRAEKLRVILNAPKEGQARLDPRLFDKEMSEEDLTEEEEEAREDQLLSFVGDDWDPVEIEKEITLVENLAKLAREVTNHEAGDAKWLQLLDTFEQPEMKDADGLQRKVVVFTEFRDTLEYLVNRFQTLLGDPEAVVAIQGGMDRAHRLRVEHAFKQDPKVRVLVATDAAGEGINLQITNQMVNYDLPWNPNRLEQRFGRIHRIGQEETCYLWNLVASGTREGDVYFTLFNKLEEIRRDLDDSVFDIIGELLEGVSLGDVMRAAVRNPTASLDRMQEMEDLVGALDIDHANKIRREQTLVLADDDFDVNAVYKEFQRVQARRLQPYLLEDFFVRAFKEFRGGIERREKGRYQITLVPPAIRNTAKDHRIGPILERYQRVCFDPADASGQDLHDADVLDVAHPLMQAVVRHVLNMHGATLHLGSILIDPQNRTADPRLLVATRSEVRGWDASGQERVLQESLQFHEVRVDGSIYPAGPAPHLELKPATRDQMDLAPQFIQPQALPSARDTVLGHVAGNVAEESFQVFRHRHQERIKRIRSQVQHGLSQEVLRLDALADELDEKSRAGKKTKLSADNARARRDRLRQRMDQRLNALEREERLERGSPEIVAVAVVLPQILVDEGPEIAQTTVEGRLKIWRAALDEVIRIETAMGNRPTDVEALKLGYDVESEMPSQQLRFIEVKGRRKGMDTVTITKNEILTLVNEPERGILAIVEVDGDDRDVYYVQGAFNRILTDEEDSSNFNLARLKSKGYDPRTIQKEAVAQ